jgi:DNA-binding beta-propeller fold protein YncE
LAVSPDGRYIYVSISDFHADDRDGRGHDRVIDVADQRESSGDPAGGNPERVAATPDGTEVWAALEAIAQGGGWNVETGEEIARFRVGIEAEGVDVSPDGRWVYVSAETTHTVTVFDRHARGGQARVGGEPSARGALLASTARRVRVG